MKRINKFNSQTAYENYLTQAQNEISLDVVNSFTPAVIEEESINNGVLYRKYTNGIIEQAGFFYAQSNNYTYTFPVPFTITILSAMTQDAYNNVYNAKDSDTSGVDYSTFINQVTLTTMKVDKYSTRGVFWHVIGI